MWRATAPSSRYVAAPPGQGGQGGGGRGEGEGIQRLTTNRFVGQRRPLVQCPKPNSVECVCHGTQAGRGCHGGGPAMKIGPVTPLSRTCGCNPPLNCRQECTGTPHRLPSPTPPWPGNHSQQGGPSPLGGPRRGYAPRGRVRGGRGRLRCRAATDEAGREGRAGARQPQPAGQHGRGRQQRGREAGAGGWGWRDAGRVLLLGCTVARGWVLGWGHETSSLLSGRGEPAHAGLHPSPSAGQSGLLGPQHGSLRGEASGIWRRLRVGSAVERHQNEPDGSGLEVAGRHCGGKHFTPTTVVGRLGLAGVWGGEREARPSR